MIWTAVILGLAGSLHCVLMCSPLALAVTAGGGFLRKILYNAGRIFTYGVAGAIVAALGKSISLTGLQSGVTIVLALTLITMGVSGISGFRIPFVTPALTRLTVLIKTSFQFFLKRHRWSSLFVMGMINGILPCGVTYLALAYCLTVAGPVDGFNFMFWFGVGTLPAMLGLTTALASLIRRYNLSATRVTRYSYIFLGVVLVARLFVVDHEVVQSVTNGVILLCR